MKHKKLVTMLACAAILVVGATGAVVFAQATGEQPGTAFEGAAGDLSSLTITLDGMDIGLSFGGAEGIDIERLLAVLEGVEWDGQGLGLFDREAMLAQFNGPGIETLFSLLALFDIEAMIDEFDFEGLRAEIYALDLEALRAKLLEFDLDALPFEFSFDFDALPFEFCAEDIRAQLESLDLEAMRARLLEIDFEAVITEIIARIDFEAVMERLGSLLLRLSEIDFDVMLMEFDIESLWERFGRELGRAQCDESLRDLSRSLREQFREAKRR